MMKWSTEFNGKQHLNKKSTFNNVAVYYNPWLNQTKYDNI